MEKLDLKTGMVVEDVRGTEGIVFLGSNFMGDESIILFTDGFMKLSSYNNDLKYIGLYSDYGKYNIEKVYNFKYFKLVLEQKNLELLWERKEVKETMLIVDGKEYSESTIKMALQEYVK